MKKILIIEDDQNILEIYKEAFSGAGYTTVSATEGKEALDKARQGGYEFVILDLMLPGIPGQTLLKKFQEIKIGGPVYVLTNIDDIKILNECIANGAKSCFVKVNYTPDQLLEAIERQQQNNRGFESPKLEHIRVPNHNHQ